MPLILIPVVLLIVPAIEIAVFIKVGQYIGAWKVVALIFLSAILGGMLLRYQSVGVIRRLDRDLRQGRTPDASLFDGFLIVVGALLLIVPGFVSDIIGLLLMIPLVRTLIRRYLASRIKVKSYGRGGGFRAGFGGGFGGPRRRGANDVVDLDPEDFERQTPRGDSETPRRPPPTIDHQD